MFLYSPPPNFCRLLRSVSNTMFLHIVSSFRRYVEDSTKTSWLERFIRYNHYTRIQ